MTAITKADEGQEEELQAHDGDPRCWPAAAPWCPVGLLSASGSASHDAHPISTNLLIAVHGRVLLTSPTLDDVAVAASAAGRNRGE